LEAERLGTKTTLAQDFVDHILQLSSTVCLVVLQDAFDNQSARVARAVHRSVLGDVADEDVEIVASSLVLMIVDSIDIDLLRHIPVFRGEHQPVCLAAAGPAFGLRSPTCTLLVGNKPTDTHTRLGPRPNLLSTHGLSILGTAPGLVTGVVGSAHTLVVPHPRLVQVLSDFPQVRVALVALEVGVKTLAIFAKLFHHILATAVAIIVVALLGVETIVANAVAAVTFVRALRWGLLIHDVALPPLHPRVST
jgi:hypothetical protein